MATSSQHELASLAVDLNTRQLVTISNRQCERITSLQLSVLSGQLGEVTEYSLIDGQVETLNISAVSQVELGLSTLCFHRNGNGNLLTISRNSAIFELSFSLTERNALHEVEVGTGNLHGRTSAGRINVVGSDGRLHEGEGNIYCLSICHHELQVTLSSSLRNSLDNNLIGSNGNLATFNSSIASRECYSGNDIHILTADGQCLTSLSGVRSSCAARRLNSLQCSYRNLDTRLTNDSYTTTWSLGGKGEGQRLTVFCHRQTFGTNATNGNVSYYIEVGTSNADGLTSLSGNLTKSVNLVAALQFSNRGNTNLDGIIGHDNLILYAVFIDNGKVGSIELQLTGLSLIGNLNLNGITVVRDEIGLTNQHLVGKSKRVDEVQVVTFNLDNVTRHG